MMRKIKRFIRMNKPFVVYIGLLLIGLIGLFAGVIPSLQRSIALVAELRVLQDEVGRIQKKVMTLNSIDQTTLDTQAQDVLFAVPPDKSISTLMSTIEAIASKNSLVISDLSIDGIGSLSTASAKIALKPEGNVVSETITLQGELIQLRNFLADSVRVRRLLRIKRLELSAIPKSSAMSMKLVIEVFYLPLPSTIGKTSDVIEPFSGIEIGLLEELSTFPVASAPQVSQFQQLPSTTVREAPTVPVLSDPFARPKLIRRTASVTPTPSVLPSIFVSPTTRPSLFPTPSASLIQ